MTASEADAAARNAAARTRLTPTERLHEVTLAFAHRAAAPPEHACEITRNAKGVAQFTVTVRGHDLDETVKSALDSFAKLVAAHPYENGGAA